MSRLLFALPALAATLAALSGVAAMPARPAAAIIGEKEPVNLGRMVVTATPL
ncbi:hypothetical protein [Sphingobium sp.]|uniref:hypothetical protein n=1 Tax=Sphingobium sp. TaxID=1912891 RepID=UPI002C4FAB76|nr:hypothetical protein [Sphingobium sp.]HUD94875.1 hypothetical protein [Sphingobium sp.]